MAHLYESLRRYVNCFQPSFKLIDKTRNGATTVKHYSQPTTPCDRLIQHDATSAEMRDALMEYRARLDPVLLLHAIREAQLALVAAGRGPTYSRGTVANNAAPSERVGRHHGQKAGLRWDWR